MVCSPLRTQQGSRASGNRPPICCLFKGVQTSESAQPIPILDVENDTSRRGASGSARAREAVRMGAAGAFDKASFVQCSIRARLRFREAR
jgi:hypothetical protein